MSLKYTNTTADCLDWDDMLNLVRKLIQDNNHKIALFITLGSFWGLRVYDIKQLTWLLILDKNEVSIVKEPLEEAIILKLPLILVRLSKPSKEIKFFKE